MRRFALLAALALVLLAGCSGVSTSDITCTGDTCDYAIRSSSFPENTSLLVREGDDTVADLDRWEWANGTVERGEVVEAYRVNWENETVKRAVTCYTENETCVQQPITLSDGGED